MPDVPFPQIFTCWLLLAFQIKALITSSERSQLTSESRGTYQALHPISSCGENILVSAKLGSSENILLKLETEAKTQSFQGNLELTK